MKIILDAMGGDNAPDDIIKGAVDALNDMDDITLVLTGPKEMLEEKLRHYLYDHNRIEIVDAKEIIEMAEPSVKAIKKKRDSSLVVGLNLIKEKKADVLITAGSTGAVVAGATLVVKRIKGIKRPALAPVLPTEKGGVLLIDCGANVDCKPSYLAQFAVMGSIYMEKVMGIQNPRVGLVNNGAEPDKGNSLTKQAYGLVEKMPIHFVGNAEGRYIPTGKFDVIVCDGFTGNIILKFMEGVASALFSMLKQELKSSLKAKIGAMMSMTAFKNFKRRMDYTDYGGALLLGVDGGIIKAHGSSNAKAILSTIRQARKFILGNVVEVIKEEISKVDFSD